MDKSIRNAAIFGIGNLIIAILIFLIEILKSFQIIRGKMVVFQVIAYIIFIILYVLFINGFVLIGKRLNQSFLVIMSYLLIISSVILLVIQMFSVVIFPQWGGLFYQIIILFVFGAVSGAVSIPFGISLLKLKEDFGGIATSAGVLNIVSGALLITIVLSFFGALLLLPAYILEIILLFNASGRL